MSKLGAAWPDVQDAFLRAWEYRPTRSESLHAIAFRYRLDERYLLGYLFAKRAAEIPFPDGDYCSSARTSTHGARWMNWRCAHPGSVSTRRRSRCVGAWWPGPTSPTTIGKGLRPNRDCSVPAMLEAAPLPRGAGAGLAAGPREAEVTVSLVAGPDRSATEQTLNSFLNCCLDVSRVGRFLVLNTGLSRRIARRFSSATGSSFSARPRPRTSRPPARAVTREIDGTVLAAPGRRAGSSSPPSASSPA